MLASGDALPDFVRPHFDTAFYLETYKDVVQVSVDPLRHWLNRGYIQGRQISRLADVRHGNDAARSSDRAWTRFRWQGQEVAIKLFAALPHQVAAQIASQQRHDAAVLADEASIAKLSQLDRTNVHLDVVGLRRAIPQAAQFLLLVPTMEAGHGLVGDLITDLGDLGPFQTIVTDTEFRAGDERPPITKPFEGGSLLFWRDYWITGPEELKIVQLAQLIRVLGPRATIVANSPNGYEVVARFGQALADRTALFCVYTADTEGVEFKARYAQRTLPSSVTLTNDLALVARLRAEGGEGSERKVVALSRQDCTGFAQQVAALFGSACHGA